MAELIKKLFINLKDTETQRKLEMMHRAEEDALYRQFSKKRAEEETTISQQIQVCLTFFIKFIPFIFNGFHVCPYRKSGRRNWKELHLVFSTN